MKRLVLCLDGTWNNPYQRRARTDGTTVLKPSNPLKLARAVASRDEERGVGQVTYYDTGVGGLAEYPGFSNAVVRFVDKKFGGAFGAGFEANVEQAATFLVHNFEPGDEVYLFGFSRGAAQARALTRFIDWMGGIPAKSDAYYLPLLFERYVKSQGSAPAPAQGGQTGPGPDQPLRPVEFVLLGVWDTVMALGSRFREQRGTSEVARSFHVGTRPAACVRHARQALAIDERRYDFRPEIWQEAAPGQTLEQRWFPGVHSNVGGGYLEDGLANLSLRWFLGEATACGLAIDTEYARHFRPYFGGRQHESYGRLYRVLDFIRRRSGRGRRVLLGHPTDANLEIDRSVLHRLVADPVEHKQLEALYRPENLVAYLKSQDDPAPLFAALGLDDDRLERVKELLGQLD